MTTDAALPEPSPLPPPAATAGPSPMPQAAGIAADTAGLTEPPARPASPATSASPATAPLADSPSSSPARGSASPIRSWWPAIAVVAVLALGGNVMLWQKLSGIQEQLARQSADATGQAAEARASARQAQQSALETAAKLSVQEARLAEVALQRSQLEELMKSLSRSRDENLLVDIESAVRLAQQQAQLTGSIEPLLAALRGADQRVARAAQPRLAPVQRAIARDIARINNTAVADLPALLVKLDELVNLADEIPLANANPSTRGQDPGSKNAEQPAQPWWRRWPELWLSELRGLVRVSRIDNPESTLLSPEQSYFVRENLKLKLLNARLGLLSRQNPAARTDLVGVSQLISRYFDVHARRTQTALALLQQIQAQARLLDIPRVDDTLTALTTAAAGR